MRQQLTDDERIIQRVKKQRSKIYLSAPGTFQMMGGLPIETSEEIATFATDGKKILVNRQFAESITDKNIRAIIIHEALHISNLHHTRNFNEHYHPALWNEACDYIINGWIKDSDNYGKEFELPDNCLYHSLYSTQGWSAEKIANDMLRKGWTPPPPSPNGPPDHGPGEILNTPVPEGSGDGEDGEDGTGVGQKTMADAIAEEERQVMERVEDAAMIEKSMGHGEGGMCNKIIKSRGATTSAELIKYFLKTNFSFQRSFKRPNRRFLHRRIYLPSKQRTPHTLYCGIDSSASVGMTEFEQYRSNLVRWAKDLNLSLIKVAYIDSYIHANQETGEPWYDIDLRNGTGADAMELDVYGGGGTSFDPIFDYIDETNEDVGAFVYFTDGYGGVRSRVLNYPVLWITSGVAPDFSDKPFGSVVHI